MNGVLTKILQDRDELRASDWEPAGMRYGPPLGRHKVAKKLAEDGWIRLQTTAWLGSDFTPSNRVKLMRNLKGLVIDGLIELAALDSGSRTSHVRLTARGELAAKKEIEATK